MHLGIAREHFTTDGALEVLFRMAVTAGKKIKTEVPFSHGNPSVIHQAIEMLDRQGYCVQDKVCMVIGNGEMGKVAAQALMESRCRCDCNRASVSQRNGEYSIWM